MLIGQHNYITVSIGNYEDNYQEILAWIKSKTFARDELIPDEGGIECGFIVHFHPYLFKIFAEKFDLDYVPEIFH